MTIDLANIRHFKIEDLKDAGDIGISLSTLFENVAKCFNEKLGSNDDVLLPAPISGDTKIIDIAEHEFLKAIQRINNSRRIDSEQKLIGIFRRGRELDNECIASAMTGDYLDLKKIVNDELVHRGFEKIRVY